MTNQTLLIGSSGKIGRLLVPMLIDADISVVAMVRDPKKLKGREGLTIVEADLENDFSHVFEGCKTVIFCAGSGPDTGLDKTFLIDLWGARKAVAYARQHGVSHFVMISSQGAADPEGGPVAMRPYLIAKHLADESLISAGISYTIIRPGRLTDDKGCGRITTQRPASTDEQKIAREDVARVILQAVMQTKPLEDVIDIWQGDQVIDQAIDQAVRSNHRDKRSN